MTAIMLSRTQNGATLIEIVFVIALLGMGSMLAFEGKNADFQSDSAAAAGAHLRTYGKAVQRWLADHPGASGTYQGSKWLKSSACGGLAPAPGYLDCSFFAADETNAASPDPITYGNLTVSTVVSSYTLGDQKQTRAVTTTSPYKSSKGVRADLAGIAAISAASGTAFDRSYIGSVTTNPSVAKIIITSQRDENADIWLKLDGSNSMNADLTFDGVDPVSRRIIGASSIQSAPGQPLVLGSATGLAFSVGAGLVVDSDTEILGKMLADGGIDSQGSVVIQSGSVSIPQGNLMTKQGFSNSSTSTYVANPAGTSNLKNLTTEGLISINGDTSLPVASRPAPFLQIKATYEELTACTELGKVGTDSSGNLLSCQAYIWRKVGKNPLLHRFVFTEDSTWTVPEDVTSAFVTLAGGGGAGYGWRVEASSRAGHSGGFLYNERIEIHPGEVLKITVGKGGTGYSPINTGVLSDAGSPFYVYAANPADPDGGMVGANGTASRVLSGTGVNLVECSGGAGAGENYGSYNTRPAGGPSSVNLSAIDVPPSTFPIKQNPGVHSIYGNNITAGVCGLNQYGLGVEGTYNTTNIGAILFGGRTPFTYGSGGDVTVTRCYIASSIETACKFPQSGKDGVVIIDVFY